LAFGAGQGVHFIYFLNQSRSIPIGFGVLVWFQDTGNEGVIIFFLTKPPRDVTIEAVIANHLLSLDLFQGFKVVFDAAIVRGLFGISGSIYMCRYRHEPVVCIFFAIPL
jgi:hypothetical protein